MGKVVTIEIGRGRECKTVTEAYDIMIIMDNWGVDKQDAFCILEQKQGELCE